MKLTHLFFICLCVYSSCVKCASAEMSEDTFTEKLLELPRIDNDHERFAKIELLYGKLDEYKKYILLPYAAKSAVILGKYDRAKYFADKLLKLSIIYKDDWNYGNAVHDGNTVLGMLALKSGDLKSAKLYLLKAGNTPGSPQMFSFGPEMMLAQALLENGEKKVVIEYLNLCKKFWIKDKGRLDSWIAAINGGGMPYFGANLSK